MSELVVTLDVPRDTMPANAIPRSLNASSDRYIRAVKVTFPAGASNLVGVRVLNNGGALVPGLGSEDTWLIASGETIIIEPNVRITDPARLEVQFYNEDQVYAHRVRVAISASDTAG